MRPNIELPWSIHGAVKEYKDAEDMSLDDAYQVILERGLEQTPVEAYNEPNHAVLEGGSFETVYYSSIDSEIGLNPITFRESLYTYPYQPVTFGKGADEQLTWDEFTHALSQLAPYLTDADDCEFTISQMGGQWYGYGLADYYTATVERAARYDDYSGTIHSSESSLLVAGLKDGGHIAISHQILHPDSPQDKWLNTKGDLTVHFQTDGYPLNSARFDRLAALFNVSLNTATKSGSKYARLTANTQVTPVETIVPPNRKDRDWAKYAIVPNPFREQPELVQELEFEDAYDGSPVDPQYWSRPRQIAAAPEYVPVAVGGMPADESRDVMVHDVLVECNTSLGSGFGHSNISMTGSDVS